MGNQKVRSSLSGILYAFEIPPAPAVENKRDSSSADVTTAVTTVDEQPGGATPAAVQVDEGETSTVERPTTTDDEPQEVRPIRPELIRSPSRTSSERSLGGSLKLPCLSRQTSDDDDEDNIEVGSEVSGRSNLGLLRQLSPRFIRKLASRKSSPGFMVSETSGTTVEVNDRSPASTAKTTPGHSRNTSVSSSSGTPVHSGGPQISHKPRSFMVGMHRKLVVYLRSAFISYTFLST